jgi:hypothetical protein
MHVTPSATNNPTSKKIAAHLGYGIPALGSLLLMALALYLCLGQPAGSDSLHRLVREVFVELS